VIAATYLKVKTKTILSNALANCALVFAARVAFATAANATPPDSQLAESETEPLGVPNVIFSTDMWGDIDDALALAMLNALQDRHEIKLVGITVSNDDKWCAPYIDLVDTFYGHPDIPVGMVHGGVNYERTFPKQRAGLANYTRLLSDMKKPDGTWVYPHQLTDGTNAPEAVRSLRKTLAQQPDHSVVVIQTGYSTNLARLLRSTGDDSSNLSGHDLILKKVRLLSVMAGNFSDGKDGGSPEENLKMDVPSAQILFSEWPTPVVASGSEIGAAILYPAYSIEHDFSYVQNHPIAETYRSFALKSIDSSGSEMVVMGWPHDHPTFDLTSVLYAARPDRDYFSLSEPGRITVLPGGRSKFEKLKGGAHRYLILDNAQKARTLEAMTMLTSQPPKTGPHPPITVAKDSAR